MSGCAMYLRKSRADLEAEAHGQGETLLRHENILRELARNMRLPVTDIFREIVSGETIDDRPEVRKLLRNVGNRQYDGVLVVDIDRLARGDTVDQGIIARTFKLSGTKIITPKKVYDPSSEFDEEYFEFELFMARREYKVISRRIQRGRLASVRDGKFIGSVPPYGYDKVKIQGGKGYTLAPNAEAETVKKIFDMYLHGSGASVIAAALDDMGAPHRGGGNWSRATVRDILANPVYIGKIRWSYRPDVKTIENGAVRKHRVKNENCILVDGLHEPIISVSDFEKAQAMAVSNRKPPVKAGTALQNPFTGLIYCGKCGSRMTRLGKNKRSKYDTIKCTNRYCDCVSAPISLVEELIIEALEKWLRGYKVRIRSGEESANAMANLMRKKAEITEKSARLDKQITAAYDLLEQGVYSVEVFSERSRLLSGRKKELSEALAKTENEIKQLEGSRLFREQVIPAAEELAACYRDCTTAEEKNALLKTVLTRIEYRKDVPNRRGDPDNANFTLELYTVISREILIS